MTNHNNWYKSLYYYYNYLYCMYMYYYNYEYTNVFRSDDWDN